MGFLNKFRGQKKAQSFEQEVLDNVYDLLSTKRHFGALQQDFGLGDYTHGRKSDDLAKRIAHEIEITIRKYEPRLAIDAIEPANTGNIFQLSFLLKCTIRETKRSVLLSFQHHKDALNMEVKS
ncbi:MAG: hypothetical protein ChlgKO_01310 [Chlamydiales bacterium]